LLLARFALTGRKPVGYKGDFLDGYRPNESHYLSRAVVAHLKRMGQTPDAERPARFRLRPSEYQAWQAARRGDVHK